MPYLSVDAIEAIAQRVTAAYKRLPAVLGSMENKVYPELLAKDLLGLAVEHHVLSRHGGILGLTACGGIGVPIFDHPEHPEYFFLDGKTILIDKSLIDKDANKGRYHFTLVHEACHQVFKMLYPKEYLPPAVRPRVHCCSLSPSAGAERWEEWRTNRLTSAVLMPADMVQMNMLAFGIGSKLEILNSVFAPHDYERFSNMADYMGVSKKALSIRMKQLGLLELDYLGAPYDFIDD